MAYLITNTSGNWADSGTWRSGDAGSLLDVQTANTALTSTFATGALFNGVSSSTIDAILLKIALRGASPTGTMTIGLSGSGAFVAGTLVTGNVSDITSGDTAANSGCGWYIFKFQAPVTLSGTTNYGIAARAGGASMINLYSSAGSNWSRILRTTTTKAPAVTDSIIIAGEITGTGGSPNSYAVTMNETGASTPIYGRIHVCDRGTLSYGASGSTAYYLKPSGTVLVYGGGTFNKGTSGTPCPASSSMTLNFACPVAGDYGLELMPGAIFNDYGNPISRIASKLTNDVNIGDTGLIPADTTNWLTGDFIVIPSTTQTRTQYEARAITGINGATIAVQGLSNAHSGNPSRGMQADLLNLTRTNKITSTSSGVTSYVLIRNGATVNMKYVEMSYLGANIVNKRGVDIQTFSSGLTNISYCSLYSGIVASADAFYINGVSANNITLDNNIVYIAGNDCYKIASATINTGIYITNCYASSAVNIGFTLADVGITFTGNTASSCASVGMSISEANTLLGNFNNMTAYSNGGIGTSISSALGGTISNITSWRNNGFGIQLGMSATLTSPFILDTFNAFGNNNVGLAVSTIALYGSCLSKNGTLNGGSGIVQPYGVYLNATADYLSFQDCVFGNTSVHSTASVVVGAAYMKAEFHNCLYSDATEFSTPGLMFWNLAEQWGISSMNHDQTPGNHKLYSKYGTSSSDSSIYNSGNPSQRLTPNTNGAKFRSSNKQVCLNSGDNPNINVAVRKSAAPDGAAYTGNQPNLMLRPNRCMGYTTGMVLSTFSSSTGVWQNLTAALPSGVISSGILEFYVDCDGTVGFVNVGDWSSTVNRDPRSGQYYLNGVPFLGAGITTSSSGVSSIAGGAWTFC